MKMKARVAMAVLTALFAGSLAQAGTFLDNFNRANTAATNAAGIGSAWFSGDAAGSETNDWAIWDSQLQYKGGAAEWYPANYMYNTNAITTGGGNFTLKVELTHNHAPESFNYNIGAIWQMGAHEGGAAIDDGFALRLKATGWQLLRMKNGTFGGTGNVGTFDTLRQGTNYTLTVTATGDRTWDFSIVRTSDGAPHATFSGSDITGDLGSGLWDEATGQIDGYGGVFYNNNLGQMFADNFSVTSPGAIEPPSIYDQWKKDYGISGEAPTDDHDLDGLANVYEYGLGGDPTNAADQGTSPTYSFEESGGTNWLAYVYPRLLDPVGIDYYLELTGNLVVSAWTNDGYFVGGTGSFNGEFDAITNMISTDPETTFVRLIIEEQ